MDSFGGKAKAFGDNHTADLNVGVNENQVVRNVSNKSFYTDGSLTKRWHLYSSGVFDRSNIFIKI
jgi:hypothetical protein